MPDVSKNKSMISRSILNYGLDLESSESLFLKAELITSRFKISDHTQLDIHSAISYYISRVASIYKVFVPKSSKIQGIDGRMFPIPSSHDIEVNDYYVWFLFMLDDGIVG